LALQAHISAGGRTASPLVAKFWDVSLTPSTWSINQLINQSVNEIM
jgi:hypothetical protein